MITTPNTDANITEIHASLPVQKEKGKTIDFFDARKMMIENLTQKVDTSQEKLDSITDKINQIIKDAEAR